MVVHHTGGVIHSQADLVVSLTGFCSSQPDLILAELTGDVRNDLAHVQPFACAEVSPVQDH